MKRGMFGCALAATALASTFAYAAPTPSAYGCGGYKPHIDGSAGEGVQPCATCKAETTGKQRGRLVETNPKMPRACNDGHLPPAVVETEQEFFYKSYRYKNRSRSASCIAVQLTQYSGTGVQISAYANSFDPNSLHENYLSDGGYRDQEKHDFSFEVAPLQDFLVVIKTDNLTSYRLDVAGCHQFVITGITPASGPPSGGTKVTIKGSYWHFPDEIFIGSQATNVTVVDENTVTAVTAATAAGTYDVAAHVRPYEPETSTLVKAFTYGTEPSGSSSSGGSTSSSGGSTSSSSGGSTSSSGGSTSSSGGGSSGDGSTSSSSGGAVPIGNPIGIPAPAESEDDGGCSTANGGAGGLMGVGLAAVAIAIARRRSAKASRRAA